MYLTAYKVPSSCSFGIVKGLKAYFYRSVDSESLMYIWWLPGSMLNYECIYAQGTWYQT